MIRRLTLAVALLILCLCAAPRPVSAYNFFQGAQCASSDNAGSTVCNSQPKQDSNGNAEDPLTGSDGILAHITNIITYVAGVAAVVVLIVSAMKLITSGSDVSTGSRTDTDVEDARRGLANAVIGLVVIVAAHTLIIYLLNRL